MKKLSKAQVKEHTDIVAGLRKSHEELDGAIQEFNRRVADAYSELEPFVASFNEAATSANDFVSLVHDDQQAYFDERSDGWREGDAGSEYESWMSEWEVEIEEVEVEQPEELEVPDVDIEPFESLSPECGG